MKCFVVKFIRMVEKSMLNFEGYLKGCMSQKTLKFIENGTGFQTGEQY